MKRHSSRCIFMKEAETKDKNVDRSGEEVTGLIEIDSDMLSNS